VNRYSVINKYKLKNIYLKNNCIYNVQKLQLAPRFFLIIKWWQLWKKKKKHLS